LFVVIPHFKKSASKSESKSDSTGVCIMLIFWIHRFFGRRGGPTWHPKFAPEKSDAEAKRIGATLPENRIHVVVSDM
jgi:hypothetical protein